MKKWAVYCGAVLLAAVLAASERGQGRDLRNLEPVETVQIQKTEGKTRIRTDTGREGTGENAAEAIESMRAHAEAVIDLDTAEYVLLDQKLGLSLERLMEYFRPGCRVIWTEVPWDLEKAGAYIKVHGAGKSIREYLAESGGA